jgi:hypothetical protein
MGDLFALQSSAIFSPCCTWRYLLYREVQSAGPLFLFSGVNGSKAGEAEEDQTTMKWRGFVLRNGGRGYLAINPFAKTATDVRELATAADPIGPENDRYIAEALAKADILVPCWGNRSKVPDRLRHRFDWLLGQMRATGKPIKTFGLTNSGDPKHPLMLGYDTPLVDWASP